MATTSKVDQVLKEVQNLNKVILGNGDPEKGIVLRLIRIEDKIDNHLKDCNGERRAIAESVIHEHLQKNAILPPPTSDRYILGMSPEVRSKVIGWGIRVAIFLLAGERGYSIFLK
jgi:hypothetical protein